MRRFLLPGLILMAVVVVPPADASEDGLGLAAADLGRFRKRKLAAE